MDKNRQRELKRAVRDAERLAFVNRMPCLPAVAAQLFDALDEEIGAAGCQHDFVLTARWCEQHSIEPTTMIAWLRSEGAGCDCETFNIEDRLNDAMEAFQ